MRRSYLAAVCLIGALTLTAQCLAAQTAPGLTIQSATPDAAGDLLTITGTGFGAAPAVTIEGEPVTVLPGGSDTQVTVPLPAALKITRGTFRLTIADTTRGAVDTFAVSIPGTATSLVTGAAPSTATGGLSRSTVGASPVPEGRPSQPAAATAADVVAPSLEGTQNTALGYQALSSLTSGTDNTALGQLALHYTTTGYDNNGTGYAAMYYNTTGYANTADGMYSLFSNTTGNDNTGHGWGALFNNTTGFDNTAVGSNSLLSSTTGSYNVATGFQSLESSTAGYYNTAIGSFALANNTTGNSNTVIGYGAGYNLDPTSSLNIMIGHVGVAGDSSTMRLGNGISRTFIAGIRGTTVTGGSLVVVDANGQLGTAAAAGFGYTDTGRVGIGTAAPETKLELLTGTNDGLMVKDGITQGILYTSSLMGHSLAFGTQSNHPIIFGTNNSFDRLTIAANGNVGVGTTTPAAKLEVKSGLNDGLRVTDGTLNGVLFASGYLGRSFAFGTQSNHAFIFGTNDTWGRLTIAANGNIGIGTMTPSQPLEMASGAYVSAGGVWTNASSRALKDQIRDLPASRALEAFASLQPVTFAYKAEPTQMHVGFIAEDVPDLVATNDRKSLSAMDLVALVTKVVQVQQQELAEERQQLADERQQLSDEQQQLADERQQRQQLEATLAALTARLTRLEAEKAAADDRR